MTLLGLLLIVFGVVLVVAVVIVLILLFVVDVHQIEYFHPDGPCD